MEEITAWMPAEGETMRMTPEGMRSLADQMVGVKVRLYGGRFVGTVIAAEVDDVGVRYTARAD